MNLSQLPDPSAEPWAKLPCRLHPFVKRWAPGELCVHGAKQTVGCGNVRKIFVVSWVLFCVTPQHLLRISGFLRAVPVPPLLFLLDVKTKLIKGLDNFVSRTESLLPLHSEGILCSH